MTCADGDPDCSEVLAEVWLYLDAECDRDEQSRIAAHLDDCSPCLREYGIEQEVKQLVGRSCGGDRAPDSLRQRLIATIRQKVAVDAQGTRVEQTTIEIREA
jgi:mycothiol system anti-sigma-R factor